MNLGLFDAFLRKM